MLQAKDPKATMLIDELNVTLVPDKVSNPNAMQITFQQDGRTRNLFVYGDDGQVGVSHSRWIWLSLALVWSNPRLYHHLLFVHGAKYQVGPLQLQNMLMGLEW